MTNKEVNKIINGYKPQKASHTIDVGVTIKRTIISHCQVCARDFDSPELVYYAPLDNTYLCRECAQVHKGRQLRIFIKEAD